MAGRNWSLGKAIAGSAALAAAGCAALAMGGYAEAHAYLRREVVVPMLNSGELRVLHISDFHAMPDHRRKFQFIARLAELEPDLVINTGDNISSADAIEPLLVALAPLLEKPGAFVLGSNDKFAPVLKNPFSYLFGNSRPQLDPTALPTDELTHGLIAAGWLDLNNHSGSLEVAGRRVDLRGTDDAHHGFADYAAVAGPVDPAADLSFGVTHAPYQWLLDAMHLDGVDMIFAGHTHGGQVCLPVNRALVTNCDLPTNQASGLSYWPPVERVSEQAEPAAPIPLHVSAGLGTSPYAPIRLFCRPSATLVRLTAQ